MDLITRSASTHTTTTSFLTIPTELRLQIYGHLLVWPQPRLFKIPIDLSCSEIPSIPNERGTHLAILSTCHLIYDEAREVLIRQNTWALRGGHFEASILASLSMKSKVLFRKIILSGHIGDWQEKTAMTRLLVTLSEYPCLKLTLQVCWVGLKDAHVMGLLGYLQGFAKVTLGSLSDVSILSSEVGRSSPIFIDKSYGDREGPMWEYDDNMQLKEEFLRQLMKDLDSARQPHVLEDGTVVKNMLQIAIYDLGFH